MSLTDFTVYNAAGTILRTGACPQEMCESQADTASGEYVIYTKTDLTTDRIDVSVPETPAPVAKQPHTMTINKTSFLANGTDVVRIDSVPSNALVSIVVDTSLGLESVIDQLVSDGWIEITTTQTGAYTITVDNGILLRYEVTVHAV